MPLVSRSDFLLDMHSNSLHELAHGDEAILLTFILGEFANAVTPVVVLAGGIFWTRSLSELGIANIFTALSTISITMVPLGTALVAMPFLAAGLASLERIRKFLAQDTFFLEPQIMSTEQLETEKDLPDFQFGFERASIHNTNYDKPLLNRVDVQFERGRIGMVVGKVGCGKSSLLKALIGEAQLTSGSVRRSKEPVGYCDQTLWIEEGSILDNVIGRSEYDEEWLDIVLETCALDEDIRQLDAGIFTAVGAGGCRLSGGQKSRVVRQFISLA